VVAEYDGGKRLTAVFKTDVISRMRRELMWSLTHGYRLFWRITPFTLIVAP